MPRDPNTHIKSHKNRPYKTQTTTLHQNVFILSMNNKQERQTTQAFMIGVSGDDLNVLSFQQANLKRKSENKPKNIFHTAVTSSLNEHDCHNPHLKAIV